MDLVTKRVFIILASLLLFAAIILRFWHLGSIPVSLYWDEAALFIDAKTVSELGTDMHGNPWYQVLYPSYGDYKKPVYIWFASVFFKVFGASALVLRSVSAVFGIFTVIVGGLLAYLLLTNNSKTNHQAYLFSLFSMAVVAFSPWSILFSRTGFEGHIGQVLVGLSAVCILLTNRTKHSFKQIIFVVLAVLLGALATYTYFSVRFVWPVIFVLTILFVSANKIPLVVPTKKWWSEVKNDLVYYLGMVVVGLLFYGLLLQPMFSNPYYQASNQFRLSASSILNSNDYALESNILREKAGNSFIDRIVFHRHWLLFRAFLKNLSQHLDFNFIFVNGDSNLRHGTGFHGLFVLPLIIPFLLGLASLFYKRRGILFLLTGWWLIALVPASVPLDVPHALRSLNALLPLALLIAYGLVTIYEYALISFSSKVVTGIFYVATIFYVFHFGYYYFNIYPSVSAFQWQSGYDELADYVLEHKNEVRTVWVHHFEDRFYLWLLTDPSITAQEIVALPKRDFKVESVDNVVFQSFDWEKLGTLDHQIMIIGQEDYVREVRKQAGVEPFKSDPIQDRTGQTRFIVDWYQPDY